MVLAILGIAYVMFHLLTLERSPLPGFDEVFFADLTRSLQNEGKMMLRMSFMDMHVNSEVLTYGPVYFYLEAFITDFLGWGIIQFRLLNFLAGFLLFVVFYKISKSIGLQKYHVILLVVLLATDTALNANIHCGRMDSVALLFFSFALYLFYLPQDPSLKRGFLSGLLFAASFLTTARVGFFLLVLPLGFFLQMDKTREVKALFLYYLSSFFGVILPVIIWIYFKFGDLPSYVENYYFSRDPSLSQMTGILHLPAWYQWPAASVWLVSFVFICVSRLRTKPILLNAIAFLPLLYMVFIKGGYTVYLMPFVYLTVVYLSETTRNQAVRIGLALLICINIGIFSIKAYVIQTDWAARDPRPFDTYFSSLAIEGKPVLASFQYYYAVTSKDNQFISNDRRRFITPNILNEKRIEHALISKTKYEEEKQFFEELGFVKQSEFNSSRGVEKDPPLISRLIRRMQLDILWNYDGVYLKRM
jgi:4-amino-4-deoxy-L-arabinose transferase-like glycosyltransferase